MIHAARYLSSRWVGPSHLVAFTIADALWLPFPDAVFDLVWMQFVAMNIADRAGMYREIRRVLRPTGRLVTYDVVRGNGEPIYPTPWAADASVSTVLTGDETRDAIEHAGLRVVSYSLDTQAALEWFRVAAATLAAGERPPGALMLRAALGENFREIVGNLGRNYMEGRADVATIIAQS
jgi:SAM-dependent methyltransferase